MSTSDVLSYLNSGDLFNLYSYNDTLRMSLMLSPDFRTLPLQPRCQETKRILSFWVECTRFLSCNFFQHPLFFPFVLNYLLHCSSTWWYGYGKKTRDLCRWRHTPFSKKTYPLSYYQSRIRFLISKLYALSNCYFFPTCPLILSNMSSYNRPS
jgi:hypothetical protein